VSTDDDKIKEVSIKYGARVLDRPVELASDTSKSEDALLHFVENVECDVVVFIQPTSPLLKTHYINKGLGMLNTYDTVFSAYREHWIPRWSVDIQPVNWQSDKRPRRQDVDTKFVENGAFYISPRDLILQSKLRYSGNIGIVEMPHNESFQIDTYGDLELVKKLI
jgi:N-acylneuraminate cytidylyltransferase